MDSRLITDFQATAKSFKKAKVLLSNYPDLKNNLFICDIYDKASKKWVQALILDWYKDEKIYSGYNEVRTDHSGNVCKRNLRNIKKVTKDTIIESLPPSSTEIVRLCLAN